MATQEEQGQTSARPDPGLLKNPFSALRYLSDEMERLFEGIGDPEPRWPRLLQGPGLVRPWSPRIDMYEREGQLVVHADLPGLTKDDVKVEITDSELQIEGERKTSREDTEEGYYRSECVHGAFSRTIRLPKGINADDARASFSNGVLEVTLPAPKHPEKHGRRVEIE